MYLYMDIASDGTCTTGSTTLAPVYQWGGSYSTTNGQFTFDIQQMSGQVGNGSAAAQTYRVFVGHVTVAAGVTTSIVWYAVMSRYQGPYVGTLPGTAVAMSVSHNLGVQPDQTAFEIKCTITNGGYAVGDVVRQITTGVSSGNIPLPVWATPYAIGATTGNTAAFGVTNKTTGVAFNPVAADWSYRFTAQRGW
jgi:hypothetical protein